MSKLRGLSFGWRAPIVTEDRQGLRRQPLARDLRHDAYEAILLIGLITLIAHMGKVDVLEIGMPDLARVQLRDQLPVFHNPDSRA
jgi:hypothetical protein